MVSVLTYVALGLGILALVQLNIFLFIKNIKKYVEIEPKRVVHVRSLADLD